MPMPTQEQIDERISDLKRMIKEIDQSIIMAKAFGFEALTKTLQGELSRLEEEYKRLAQKEYAREERK